jgi:hypothetical protein
VGKVHHKEWELRVQVGSWLLTGKAGIRYPPREQARCEQGGASRARAGAERRRKTISRSTENPFPIPWDENAFQFLATSVLQTV